MSDEDFFCEDWEATSAIYADNEALQIHEKPDGSFVGIIDLALTARDLALVSRTVDGTMFDLDPRYAFRIITGDDAPKVQLQFRYCAEGRLVNVKATSFTSYPDAWPIAIKTKWLEWLDNSTKLVLSDTQMSYPVCEFVEHEACTFIGPIYSNTDGQTVIFNKHSRDLGEVESSCTVNMIRLSTNKSKGKRRDTTTKPDLKTFARQTVVSKWREWTTVECPVCFDTLKVSEAIEITCRHLFCQDCIETFTRTIVPEIKNHRQNPFLCPVPSCRVGMRLVQCVKPLLSEEEFEKVRKWYRDLIKPPSALLQMCPRKCCGSKSMRMASDDTHMVFCDACGVTWCELCMQRYNGAHEDCDPTILLRFCERYRQASREKKALCDEKWPWIKDYASARLIDEVALKWVQENASRCPKCVTAIERIEGCFHMRCTQCATHFCYECGTELSYPYYGTHHCWEERNFVVEGEAFA